MGKFNPLYVVLVSFIILVILTNISECQKKKPDVRQIKKLARNFLKVALPNYTILFLQQASGLSERYQQIMDLSSKRTVIKLNGNRYRELVRTSPRNYSVVVMFTAMSAKRQCTICK